MRPLLILALTLATAAAPRPRAAPLANVTDAAGNRMEALPKLPAAKEGETVRTLCTPAPQLCLRAATGGAGGNSMMELARDPAGPALASLAYYGGGDRVKFEPWPYVVRLAGSEAVLLGISEDASTGYSGGGGWTSTLNLLLAAPDRDGKWTLRNVLSMPIYGAKMIRSCFGRADMRARRGACHDEYRFTAKLTLAPDTRTGKPRFVVETLATTYPADVTAGSDGPGAGPLKPGQLVKKRDPRCSYRRTLTANAAWDYLPDAPFPDCAAYFLP